MPQVRESIAISLQEYNFVQAYCRMDSVTFGNARQSALQAGYSPSYACVILRYFPRWRLKQIQQFGEDEQVQVALEMAQEESGMKPPEMAMDDGTVLEIVEHSGS